jgi:hypothetical protein
MTIGTVYSAAKKDLQSLAQWSQDQLATLASSIATGWNVEHDGDGHHSDVTATRVRTGSLGLTGFYKPDLTGLASVAPLIVPAKISLVQIKCSSGTHLDLYGIQQDGAQFGDILVIGANTVPDVRIFGMANSTVAVGTVPIGTEVVWDFLFQPTSPLVLSVSSFRSPIILMYMPTIGSQAASAWGLLRGVTP